MVFIYYINILEVLVRSIVNIFKQNIFFFSIVFFLKNIFVLRLNLFFNLVVCYLGWGDNFGFLFLFSYQRYYILGEFIESNMYDLVMSDLKIECYIGIKVIDFEFLKEI